MNLRDKLMSRAKGEVFGKEWCSPAEARLLLAALELAERVPPPREDSCPDDYGVYAQCQWCSAQARSTGAAYQNRVGKVLIKHDAKCVYSAFRAAKEAYEQGAKDAE